MATPISTPGSGPSFSPSPSAMKGPTGANPAAISGGGSGGRPEVAAAGATPGGTPWAGGAMGAMGAGVGSMGKKAHLRTAYNIGAVHARQDFDKQAQGRTSASPPSKPYGWGLGGQAPTGFKQMPAQQQPATRPATPVGGGGFRPQGGSLGIPGAGTQAGLGIPGAGTQAGLGIPSGNYNPTGGR